MEHNFEDPLAILLAQIVMNYPSGPSFWLDFQKIKQPTVIGEIIIELFLGPHYCVFSDFRRLLFPLNL
jgi:hypothetical protein